MTSEVPKKGAAVLALLAAAGCAEPVLLEESWTVRGREASVRLFVATDQDAARARTDIGDDMESVLRSMDYNLDGSELSELNRLASDGFHAVEDRDLYRAVLLALDYARASRGAFDPTVGPLMRLYGDGRGARRVPRPGEIETVLNRVGWNHVRVAEEARAVRFLVPDMLLDLDGLSSGFAIDVAARVFTRAGSRGAVVRLGNSLYTWGSPPGADTWRVAVPDPRAAGVTLLFVSVGGRGLAVSGHAESETRGETGRLRLLLDSETGLPVGGGLRVALAVADSAADADALATALFAAGITGASELLERTRRVESVLLVEGETGPYALASASLEGRLELGPELDAEIGGQVRYVLPPKELEIVSF